MDVDVPPPAYTPGDIASPTTQPPDAGAWPRAGTWFDDASSPPLSSPAPPQTSYTWLSEAEREREYSSDNEPLPRYAPTTVPVYTFADHHALAFGNSPSSLRYRGAPRAVFVWRQDTKRRRSIEPLLAPGGAEACPSYSVEARTGPRWWWSKAPEWTLVRRAPRHARFEEEMEEQEDAGAAWRSESFASGGSEESGAAAASVGSEGSAGSENGSSDSPTSSAGEGVPRAPRRSSTRGSTATAATESCSGGANGRRWSDAAWSTTAEVAHLDLERSQHVSGFGLAGSRFGHTQPQWMPRARLALVRDPLAAAPRIVRLSAPNFSDFELALDDDDQQSRAPPSPAAASSRSSTEEDDTLAFSPTSFSSSSESSSRSSYTSTSSSSSSAATAAAAAATGGSNTVVTSAEPARPATIGSCFPHGRPPPPLPPRRRRLYTWRLVTEPDESSTLVLLDRTAGHVLPAPVVARFAYAAREGRRDEGRGEEVGTLEVYAKKRRGGYDGDNDEEEAAEHGGEAVWREWELEVLIGTCELVCQYWRSMGRRFRGGVGSAGGYAAGSSYSLAGSSSSASSAGLSAAAAAARRRRAWRGAAAGGGRGPVVWDGGVDASWNDMY
jgi:hypothetical protein